ncbi:DUF2891 domain-containing protein [Novosphingobium album (ex Hu et al. 2023)]|uniref:DUF2891 domain-containing protein n=1 Tax=Novosphingobium album (ex Hu et al. 2023) TaxID=2930093 RepID=A0ABT0B299_9SPHN|nr:DUF2891 domain-containing protein [Novosphingobium album (ex Hu et al. 2023)]MCJ2179068.1 DUF2891 domain-containing protein [Novosphingobium album (ex Hu et al. 2023)]
MPALDPETAARFAALTLSHLGQEYPHKLDHVLDGDADALPPRVLHPIFHGSFDWHSCVHGWWQVLTLARLYPDLPEAAAVRARADAMLTPELVAAECAYLDRPSSAGFERPYGWGWLLALHGEAMRHVAPWGPALTPLAEAFAQRFRTFLPKQTYPIRTGTHFNSAFALALAHEWAVQYDRALATQIAETALGWFGADRGCQAWEPGGDEFLSSALTEAMLMSRLLDSAAFTAWFEAFLPDAAQGLPATLFTPATVSDRSDGKIAHLDGLNLSRAWCWREIAVALGEAHPVAAPARAAAERHIAASLPHIADDYMGTHWLASFALLALL